MPPQPVPMLFTPLSLGGWSISHRVVMATPPRHRARPDGLPTALMAQHHGQRASAGGLVISEPITVQRDAPTSSEAPGLYTSQQANLWRQVTDAVHQRGGLMLAQLGPGLPQAALDAQALDSLSEALRDAAELAGDAGFDGVELCAGDHAAAVVDLLPALIGVWGGDRVGLGLGPGPACAAAAAMTAQRWPGIAYLRLSGPALPDDECLKQLRHLGGAALLVCGDHSPADAVAALERGRVDALSFELAFVANPDLPQRLRRGAALAEPDRATLHQGGAHGYTDYAALDTPT